MWILGLLACLGGGVRHEVDRADLAQLDTSALGALADEEHALSVALTSREGALAEAKRADQRVDEARALREQARLEHKTALASLDAARASGDLYRRGIAEGAEASARRDLAAADARLAWQEAARRAADDAIDLADLAIDLREAQLQLARYDLLAAAGRAGAYRRADFADQVADAQDDYDEGARAHERLVEDAANAFEDWRGYEQGAAPPPGTR